MALKQDTVRASATRMSKHFKIKIEKRELIITDIYVKRNHSAISYAQCKLL